MLDSFATSTLEASVVVDATAGVRVALQGELDLAAAPALSALLDSPVVVGATSLLLDLTGIHFLDLAGLRVLVAARERTAPPARLVLGDSRTRRLFDLTGHADVIDDAPPRPGSAAARSARATQPTLRGVGRAGSSPLHERASCCAG